MRIAATSSELKVANPLFDFVRIINPNEQIANPNERRMVVIA